MLSPPKKFIPPHKREYVKKPVVQNLEKALVVVTATTAKEQGEIRVEDKTADGNMLVDPLVGDGTQERSKVEDQKKMKKYKRVHREGSVKDLGGSEPLVGKKRSAEEEELEGQKGDKNRRELCVVEDENVTFDDVGLVDQSCKNQ